MTTPMPTCWIIAGPNGAGKTTFALDFLPRVANCHRFLNADLIAAGLSPLSPQTAQRRASRVLLQTMREYIAAGQDYALETTLSGRTYLHLVRELRGRGWNVDMVYLALPTRQMSHLRVAERVAHGGHDVPSPDIERRFGRSLRNLLDEFSYAVTRCLCILNSGPRPVPVFEQLGEQRQVLHEGYYDMLLAAARAS